MGWESKRLRWTSISLFVFLVCCQIPLYGVLTSKSCLLVRWKVMATGEVFVSFCLFFGCRAYDVYIYKYRTYAIFIQREGYTFIKQRCLLSSGMFFSFFKKPSWTFLRFWNKDSGIPTHGLFPKKVSWKSAASFGSKDVKVPILFIGCEWSWLQIEGLWWSNFVGKWGGIFRWVEVSSASFVTRLLRNLQNARVGGNSSWFYRYTCRCRLNTNNFFSAFWNWLLPCRRYESASPILAPWSHGPIPESLRLGISPIITSGMAPWICDGFLSLFWKKKPGGGNFEPILFADF